MSGRCFSSVVQINDAQLAQNVRTCHCFCPEISIAISDLFRALCVGARDLQTPTITAAKRKEKWIEERGRTLTRGCILSSRMPRSEIRIFYPPTPILSSKGVHTTVQIPFSHDACRSEQGS